MRDNLHFALWPELGRLPVSPEQTWWALGQSPLIRIPSATWRKESQPYSQRPGTPRSGPRARQVSASEQLYPTSEHPLA